MKVFKQPWFLILLIVVSVYSYQFYKNPKSIEISTTTASAINQKEDSESADSGKEPVSVKISQSFPSGRSQNFELSTYYNMKVKFAKTDGEQVIVSLIGEGTDYKNNGQRLADWFQVSSAGKTLKIKSFDKKNFAGFSSMKELAKSFNGKNSESDFTMIIEFPENFKFEQIKLEGVTNDVYASGLTFESFKMATVSGDLRLKESQGKEIKVESVSGDSHVEVSGMEKAEFASVSGNAIVQSDTTNPELKFESVSGDLDLKIPKDSQVDVSFESMTGDLINDFGISKASGKKLKFSSLSGSAKITKM